MGERVTMGQTERCAEDVASPASLAFTSAADGKTFKEQTADAPFRDVVTNFSPLPPGPSSPDISFSLSLSLPIHHGERALAVAGFINPVLPITRRTRPTGDTQEAGSVQKYETFFSSPLIGGKNHITFAKRTLQWSKRYAVRIVKHVPKRGASLAQVYPGTLFPQ